MKVKVEKLRTLAEVSALISRGVSTLRKDIAAGRLGAVRLSGRWVRIPEHALEKFLTAEQQTPIKTARKRRTR